MGMMDALKKKIKASVGVAAEVMSSPCCEEDEAAGSGPLQTERRDAKR